MGFSNVEFFVPLLPRSAWPAVQANAGFWALLQPMRARTKLELVTEMSAELNRTHIGVGWNFSQNIRDNVKEVLSGVKGNNSVKIFGPDLARLEEQAESRLDSPLAPPPW